MKDRISKIHSELRNTALGMVQTEFSLPPFATENKATFEAQRDFLLKKHRFAYAQPNVSIFYISLLSQSIILYRIYLRKIVSAILL